MQKIMAANWKMFKTRAEARATAEQLRTLVGAPPAGRSVLVFAPYTAIADVAQALEGAAHMATGGQNVYPADEGAFTGEISPGMLRDAGAQWALVGHSERRQILGETLDFIARKTAFALEKGLNVLLCVGESLTEREEGKLAQVLTEQLQSALAVLPSAADSLNRLAVAYEPVWAIGTGKVAGPPEILEAHALVRSVLENSLGDAGRRMPILYGGSVKPDNATAILKLDNVDGVLVGGASLQAESFARIVTA